MGFPATTLLNEHQYYDAVFEAMTKNDALPLKSLLSNCDFHKLEETLCQAAYRGLENVFRGLFGGVRSVLRYQTP